MKDISKRRFLNGLWEKKANYYYLLSFLIGSILIFFILYIAELLPGSRYCFMSGDLGGLTIPLIKDFCRGILNGETPFFSWSQNLGMNQSFYFAYCGIIGPFTLFFLLFPDLDSNIIIALCICIKVGMAAMAFQLFVRIAFHKNDFFSVVFSIFYSLCSFQFVCNISNFLWMDALYVLPIVFLSIYYLAQKGNALPLFFSYAYIFIIQFYMGYMIGIASFVFFFCGIWLIEKKISKREYVFRYIWATITAIMISAIIWCPVLHYILHQYPDDTSDFSNFSVNIIQFISQLFFSNNPTQKDMLPSLYCGSLTIILMPVFFIFSKNYKDKILYGITLSFLFLSCIFLPLYKLMHAFDFPDEWYFRFTFIISFMLCVVALKATYEMALVKNKFLWIELIVFVLFNLFVTNWFQDKYRKWPYYSAGVVFMLCWIVILVLIKKTVIEKRFLQRRILLLVCLLVTCIECVGNGYTWRFSAKNIVPGSTRIAYNTWMKEQKEIMDYINNDGTVFRVDYIDSFSNSDLLEGYYNISDFGTAENVRVRNTLSNLGLATSPRTISPYGSTEFTDMILGVKYRINTTRTYLNDSIYSDCIDFEELPYVLGMGYMVDESIKDLTFDENPFHNNNELCRKISGLDMDVYQETSIPMRVESNGLSIERDDEGYIFSADSTIDYPALNLVASVDNSLDKEAYICFINDKSYFVEGSMFVIGEKENLTHIGGRLSSSYIRKLDYDGENAEIGIYSSRASEQRVKDIKFAYLNQKSISEVYKVLSSNQLEITEFRRGYLKGKISVPSDKKVLFTTIPYDKGWNIFVDGKKMECITLVDDTFIGLEFPKSGEYEIEMKFTPGGLKEGLLLSLTGCILFAVYLLLAIKNRKGALQNV